jgi:hypothetical protein
MRSQLKLELNFTESKTMKRLIASAVALSVIAAPAFAATASAVPAKVTKHMKKSSKLAGAKVTKASVKTTKGK